VTFDGDGKRIACGGTNDWTVQLWEVESGEQLSAFAGEEHDPEVNVVAFTADGARIAAADERGELRLWDIETGAELFPKANYPPDNESGGLDAVIGIAFSPDEGQFTSIERRGTVKLCDLETRKVLRAFESHAAGVECAAFSPAGRLLASGSKDRTVKLWDIESGRQLRTFKGHFGTVIDVAFSPDGRRIASADNEGTVKLWDIEPSENPRVLAGHSKAVLRVRFSPDGARLASVSDRSVKLWQIESGKELSVFNSTKSYEAVRVNGGKVQGDCAMMDNLA
jgi:WD40 repeat protein